MQSLFERQGLAFHGALHPALEKAHMQLPKSMARTKSFGNTFGIIYNTYTQILVSVFLKLCVFLLLSQ